MANKKFLDSDGLALYDEKIKQVIEGKVSKNGTDRLMTAEEGTKLAGLENYTLPTASETVKGGIKIGAGLKMTGDILSATGGGTADSVAWENVVGRPTKVSEFTNDGDGSGSKFATESYVNTNGGKIDKIKVNNAEQTITDKAVNITVPTNNNQLTNGAGYQTSSQVESAITGKGYQTASQVSTAIGNAIKDVTQFDFEIVSSLPSTGVKGKIYLVAHSGTATQNIYDEYIWITDKFEKLGTTEISIENCVKYDDVISNETINGLFN